MDTRAAKEEAPLKIAIAHDKKTAYIPLGVKISPKQWDESSKSVKSHPKEKELNIFLRSRLSFVETEILKLDTLGRIKGKSAIEVRDMIDFALNPEKKAKKDKDNSFLSRIERYKSLQTKKKTISTFDWTLKWCK